MIDDDGRPHPGAAARLVLGEGLLRHRRPRAAPDGADIAVPGSSSSTPSRSRRRRARRLLPALEEVVWAQEEPQNMGAWRAIRHRLEEAIGGRVPLRYVGRPWRASRARAIRRRTCRSRSASSSKY